MSVALRRVLQSGPPHPAPGRDDGGIVLGWLTRITLILAAAGLVLFDAISVGSTTATVADQGTYAAQAASEAWDQTKNVQAAYAAAVAKATEQNPENVVANTGFQIDPDGTVHLVISREARTLLLYRWSRTAKWAEVSRAAKGRSVDA